MEFQSQDKPLNTKELKNIHRRKSREYFKNGKSMKYNSLRAEFERKYKMEAKKYIEKNVEEPKVSKPGKAFCTLKKLGAQPGDCNDSNSFILPSHTSENLSALQSAERIADHFADISNDYPPLNPSLLPDRVQTKLVNDTSPPSHYNCKET